MVLMEPGERSMLIIHGRPVRRDVKGCSTDTEGCPISAKELDYMPQFAASRKTGVLFACLVWLIATHRDQSDSG